MASVADASERPPVGPAEGTAERAVEVTGPDGFAGCGYAIADDLVLTSVGVERRDLPHRVRPPGRTDWYEAAPVWRSGDVGLFRVGGPYWSGVPGPPMLLTQAPSGTDSTPCLVVGFGRGSTLEAVPGELSAMPVGPGRVPVDLQVRPHKGGGPRWPGFSGAPVLSVDGQVLLGVVVAERQDGMRLEAAPIWQAVAAGLGEFLASSNAGSLGASVQGSSPPAREASPPAPSSTRANQRPAEPDDRLGDQVEWQSDAPTTRDVLRRDALAAAIAERLERRADEDTQSFLMLLDGRWGSGKSSVLRMTEARLAAAGWVVVNYDAWRQSRLGASWWTLLGAVRRTALGTLGRPHRVRLRVEELWRQRLARTPAVLALSLVVAAALGLFLLLRPAHFDLSSLGTGLQSVAAVVTAIGTLWAGAIVTARFLLWQSRRSARFFEETADNPLNQVAEHLGWLIDRLARPLLVVVDDLDRCRADQVVELLESVQTLLRDAPPPSRQRMRRRHPVAVVVAADAAWLHRAFEHEYDGFGVAVAEPGKPLGYLFCDKIFQLVVPMPGLGVAGQAAFLSSLLGTGGAEPSGPRDADAVREAARRLAGSGSEAEVLQILADVAPPVREQVAPAAVEALTRPELTRSTEHTLARFARLLPANPRSMKRFINDYSMARAVRTLEGDPVPVDALAQWTVIRTRWPALAAYLAECPDAAADGVQGGAQAEVEHARLLASPEVRRVLAVPEGTSLTPELIRRCHGVGGNR